MLRVTYQLHTFGRFSYVFFVPRDIVIKRMYMILMDSVIIVCSILVHFFFYTKLKHPWYFEDMLQLTIWMDGNSLSKMKLSRNHCKCSKENVKLKTNPRNSVRLLANKNGVQFFSKIFSDYYKKKTNVAVHFTLPSFPSYKLRTRNQLQRQSTWTQCCCCLCCVQHLLASEMWMTSVLRARAPYWGKKGNWRTNRSCVLCMCSSRKCIGIFAKAHGGRKKKRTWAHFDLSIEVWGKCTHFPMKLWYCVHLWFDDKKSSGNNQR